MPAWSRKLLKSSFFVFFWKNDYTVKFSKIGSDSFHRYTDGRVVFKFREIWPTKVDEIVGCLPDKKNKISPGSRYCADRAQNLPGPALDNVVRVLQISSKWVHFRRSYSRTREHRRNAPYKVFQHSAEA